MYKNNWYILWYEMKMYHKREEMLKNIQLNYYNRVYCLAKYIQKCFIKHNNGYLT